MSEEIGILVELSVIPNMYHCELCQKLISQRTVLGKRENGKNYYYHLTPKDCEDGKEKS